ncbi:MAG: 3-oxo-tetronate kinase [Planctomycetota bacterium]
MSVQRKSIFLGCIADDVTGATDIASNLVQAGMRTVQVFGVPTSQDLDGIEADAVVVALKSRSIDPATAVSMSLQSLASLKQAGTQRFFFKYCSTFDSTPTGNIGPVAEALMKELEISQTVFCPAFPANGRTVYQGHLFVNGQLLSESGMEDHPLNPMTDANLVRVLQCQTTKKVGLVDWNDIRRGNVRSVMESLSDDDVSMVITDACDDDHLQSLAQQMTDLEFLTGGSGIARWLPQAWRDADLFCEPESEPYRPSVSGRAAVLSGSCSRATNRQVEYLKSRVPSLELDVERLIHSSEETLATVEEFFQTTPAEEPVMVYSTSGPDRVTQLQQTHGVDSLAEVIEDAMGTLAQRLIDHHDVRRLILAGGETSGAITRRLNIKTIRVGPEICPGVPWTETVASNPLTLVLKSGNFGDDDFFETAIRVTA